MITRLRQRERLDTLGNDTRVANFRWGRYVYFALLIAFFLGLANYLVGSWIFLRADGLVLQEMFAVAPSYEGKIVSVHVKPGQKVEKGELLVRLESSTLVRALAELSFREAEITSRLEQLKSKLAISETMLPLAQSQLAEMDKGVASLGQLKRRQLTNQQRVEELVISHYSASSQLAELEVQKNSLGREIAANEAARAEAVAASDDLKRLYNNGALTAPTAGTVGPVVASSGEVLVPGDRALEVFSGAPYVLAYLPETYLFDVRSNQRVSASSGRQQAIGRIVEILPVAANLPAEFQNTFRPRERSQLIRVELDRGAGFPSGQKVRLTRCLFENCESVLSMAGRVGAWVSREARNRLRAIAPAQSSPSSIAEPDFSDDFNGQRLDRSKWLVGKRNWGGKDGEGHDYNGGVSPQNVGLQEGALVLKALGDSYRGPVRGVNRDGTPREDGTRVGAMIATRNYLGSGRYEARLKVAPVLGVATAMWAFHYREEGNHIGNHEIDIEFPGRPGPPHEGVSFNRMLANTWIGEREGESTTQYVHLPATIADGQFHIVRFDWRAGSATSAPSVVFFVDGREVASIDTTVPTRRSRLYLGAWFPKGWAGQPTFAEAEVVVDWVRYWRFDGQDDRDVEESFASVGWE
ncbi:family 16 glycosylhydrolase [Flaviflagellibacter deserti]|uniref:Family 16 glycosylhydrolase n=1 Tax=Flaviflagellibacter deserti TaxID=2267266 RepID=A0ABV9Z3V8_9HYPH